MLQVQSWLQASYNTGILNTCTRLWLTESEQTTPVDSIKEVVRSSVKVPEFDKHLKKARGHTGRNVVEITIKMKTIVWKPLMIKIIKLRLRNLDDWYIKIQQSEICHKTAHVIIAFKIQQSLQYITKKWRVPRHMTGIICQSAKKKKNQGLISNHFYWFLILFYSQIFKSNPMYNFI